MGDQPAKSEESNQPNQTKKVGITNRDLEVEDANQAITAEHGRLQRQNKIPMGTHEEGGQPAQSQDDPLLGIDPGSEAERGGDNANQDAPIDRQ